LALPFPGIWNPVEQLNLRRFLLGDYSTKNTGNEAF
jgi:hypothetical protein